MERVWPAVFRGQALSVVTLSLILFFYLFCCFNLSQVNNILCCLKMVCREKKVSLFCWNYLPVTSLSSVLGDAVIIKCCFLPAITFRCIGSNTAWIEKRVKWDGEAGVWVRKRGSSISLIYLGNHLRAQLIYTNVQKCDVLMFWKKSLMLTKAAVIWSKILQNSNTVKYYSHLK